MMGLMRAIKTYDPKKGEFSTYAIPWIKQYIQRYYDDNRSVVRIPVYLRGIQGLYSRLKSENEEADDEFFVRVIGRLKGVSPLTVLWAIRLHNGNHCTSIHQVGSDGEEFNLADLVAATEPEIAENINFKKLFEVLTYREQFVLMKRFDNWTLENISSELELSRERVRQIQDIALRKVKACVRMANKQYLFKEN
jgi:RNA polymerase primary sigma factor